MELVCGGSVINGAYPVLFEDYNQYAKGILIIINSSRNICLGHIHKWGLREVWRYWPKDKERF